jgi:hypothetical protein
VALLGAIWRKCRFPATRRRRGELRWYLCCWKLLQPTIVVFPNQWNNRISEERGVVVLSYCFPAFRVFSGNVRSRSRLVVAVCALFFVFFNSQHSFEKSILAVRRVFRRVGTIVHADLLVAHVFGAVVTVYHKLHLSHQLQFNHHIGI